MRKFAALAVFLLLFLQFYYTRQVLIFRAFDSEQAEAHFTENGTSDGSFNFQFERSRFQLPNWLEQFLQTQPTATHNETLSDPDAKFIVMTCYRFKGAYEEACGGFTDRMTLLPYNLWLANQTGRKLLIKYVKPFPLEEFLVPPKHGFDWRLPNGFFDKEFDEYGNRSGQEYRRMRRMVWHRHIHTMPWNETRVIFVNNNLAIPKVLGQLTQLTGMVREDVWPGIFRRLFQASPAVAEIVTSIAEQHGLVPGNYAGVHFRAKFPVGLGDIILGRKNADMHGGGLKMSDPKTKEIIQNITDNAVNCVLQIMPETNAVYFASDTNEPAQYLMTESPWAKHFAKSSAASLPAERPWIVTRPNSTVEPAHFDRGNGRYTLQDIYPTFVDLWMLSHAKCIAQGVGGFAHFASELTGNHHTCRIRHRNYVNGSLTCPNFLQGKRQAK